MSPDLLLQLQQRLNQHEAQQLIRQRIIHTQEPLLNFTSNDYLSLAQHPDMIKPLHLGASGSPVTYYTPSHHALEQRIAQWVNYPRALVFTSGYLAVLSAITALIGHDDFIAVDKQCHASVFDAIQLSKASWQRYADDDQNRLETLLKKSKKGLRFIITSSIFSMQGHLADLNRLMDTAKKYNATLIIDDIHGTGILGPEGQGAVAHWNLTHEMPLFIGSLTKGLGTLGAFVTGNAVMIETILQFARPYMFSTTLPHTLAAASITAINIAEKAHVSRAHLKQLIAYFQQQALALDLNILPSNTPIQALVFSDIDQMQKKTRALLDKNILVSAIRPPTVPKNSPRIRITLTAAHQFTDIDRLFMELTTHE
jgi:8-amino-7-oxononanoate synthase